MPGILPATYNDTTEAQNDGTESLKAIWKKGLYYQMNLARLGFGSVVPGNSKIMQLVGAGSKIK